VDPRDLDIPERREGWIVVLLVLMMGVATLLLVFPQTNALASAVGLGVAAFLLVSVFLLLALLFYRPPRRTLRRDRYGGTDARAWMVAVTAIFATLVVLGGLAALSTLASLGGLIEQGIVGGLGLAFLLTGLYVLYRIGRMAGAAGRAGEGG
jgi:amino acid transporter